MAPFTVDTEHSIIIPSRKVHLDGILYIPTGAHGIVLFAHGSGSGRFSVRNQFVAKVLNEAKLATLLFDLLTPEEERIDDQTRELRFDIGLLAARLIDATRWCLKELAMHNLSIGYFGASTGGGAALVAAAQDETVVKAVVSRGGRPDLADRALPLVKAPTLFIVGGNDEPVIAMNHSALAQMQCVKKLAIVPGATHLFAEPGTLEAAAHLARDWFILNL